MIYGIEIYSIINDDGLSFELYYENIFEIDLVVILLALVFEHACILGLSF